MITVKLHAHSDLVVRESDGATLFLVEVWSVNRDEPLAITVIDPEDLDS